MTIPNLPWIIGPLPILLTLWSVYDYVSAFLRREMAGGARIASALLLPLGAICFLFQLGLSNYSFIVLSISAQILTAILFGALIYALNYRSIGRFIIKEHAIGLGNSLKGGGVCLLILVFINSLSYLFGDGSPCTIGKCFAIEYVVGTKADVFSGLYLTGIIGSFFSFGLFMSLYAMFKSMRA